MGAGQYFSFLFRRRRLQLSMEGIKAGKTQLIHGEHGPPWISQNDTPQANFEYGVVVGV